MMWRGMREAEWMSDLIYQSSGDGFVCGNRSWERGDGRGSGGIFFASNPCHEMRYGNGGVALVPYELEGYECQR